MENSTLDNSQSYFSILLIYGLNIYIQVITSVITNLIKNVTTCVISSFYGSYCEEGEVRNSDS